MCAAILGDLHYLCLHLWDDFFADLSFIGAPCQLFLAAARPSWLGKQKQAHVDGRPQPGSFWHPFSFSFCHLHRHYVVFSAVLNRDFPHVRIRYNLIGWDTRPSPERLGFEFRWRHEHFLACPCAQPFLGISITSACSFGMISLQT